MAVNYREDVRLLMVVSISEILHVDLPATHRRRHKVVVLMSLRVSPHFIFWKSPYCPHQYYKSIVNLPFVKYNPELIFKLQLSNDTLSYSNYSAAMCCSR